VQSRTLLLSLSLSVISSAACATRSLPCEQQKSARRREICEAIAARSRLDLAGGHEIFNPSWQNEEGAIADVFCTLNISRADAPELEQMSREAGESRLGTTARDLYELANPAAAHEESLNHPKHDAYRLKGGCPRPKAEE
jgi:hypothetical protein